MNFALIKSKPALILTALLLAQAAMLYSFTRKEEIPATRPLAELPNQLGEWDKVTDAVMDQETLDTLNADDIVNRVYAKNGVQGNVFVALFRSQRNGKAPHSPKNCLPGSGWMQDKAEIINVNVPNRATPLEANRYVVMKGDAKAVVIYWYQSRERAVASEYWAKYYVIKDAIQYNRSDTSLIKVITYYTGDNLPQAEKLTEDLIQASYPKIMELLPRQ